MSDAQPTQAQIRTLREAEEREHLKTVEPMFHEAMRTANLIPLRNKTQFPLYIEARDVTMLRAIADFEGGSVQGLIREGVEELIKKRTIKKKRRPAKTGS